MNEHPENCCEAEEKDCCNKDAVAPSCCESVEAVTPCADSLTADCAEAIADCVADCVEAPPAEASEK